MNLLEISLALTSLPAKERVSRWSTRLLATLLMILLMSLSFPLVKAGEAACLISVLCYHIPFSGVLREFMASRTIIVAGEINCDNMERVASAKKQCRLRGHPLSMYAKF